MRTCLLFMVFMAVIFAGCLSAEAKEYKIVAHIVSAGDTLDIIVAKYLPEQMAHSERAIADFKDVIIKYNYELIFSHRRPNEIREGDCLFIALWE